ncbi:MAG: acyl-CoA desaturase [Bacteroidota bacterium]
MRKLKFSNQVPEKAIFFKTLRSRVDAYFQDNQLVRFGGNELIGKTVVMFLLYFVPYALILTNWFSPLAMWGLVAIMALGKGGIGFCVMHDANHGSYSPNKTLNYWLGLTLNLVGGCAMTWKIQHNVLHHTYTNVPGVDDDIADRRILRFSPTAKLRWFHRYQHYYAFLVYGLMTFNWILVKDFAQLRRYKKQGLLENQKVSYWKEVGILSLSKVVYFGYTLVLPMMLTDITWWQWAIGFFTLHYITGLILAVIFQMAHVVEETTMPFPTEGGTIENLWAVHQLETTVNFSTNNRFLNYYAGGLNFQVEHHLFPKISHVHYKKLSKVVKDTAEEFGIPYHEKTTLMEAIRSHRRLLKRFGRPEPVDNTKTPVLA